ncbi:MAG: hypothetical protein M3025_08635 [Actinomycetota bacterium]|nr:hypothetical protein [Actinomycetota bacterium]
MADAARAGNALVTLIVADLDAWIGRLDIAGISPGEPEDLAGGVRKSTFLDRDGKQPEHRASQLLLTGTAAAASAAMARAAQRTTGAGRAAASSR